MDQELLSETIRRTAWLIDYFARTNDRSEEVHHFRMMMERAQQQLRTISPDAADL